LLKYRVDVEKVTELVLCEGDHNNVISGREFVMLHAIVILGGWLLMMGQHSRSESLFYYFRIEDQVPENHFLRVIDRHVGFDFVREKLRAVLQRNRSTLD